MQQNKSLSINLPILDGSLAVTHAKCGTKNCGCQTDRAKWHGPYYRWTGKLKGKRTTVALTKDQFKECEIRIANYKKLLKKIDSLVEHAQKNAPWV